MKYTLTKQDITCEIAFDITKEEWEKHTNTAYNKTKHKYSVAGFRKGHAPRKVLENVYGESFLYEDALDVCFNAYYQQVLDENKELEVVAHPELKDFKVNEDKSAVIIALAPIKPEVTLGAYTGLAVKKQDRTITEEAVDKEIDSVKEKYVRVINIEDRPVIAGDEITFDFSGSVDGEKFDGGTAKDYKLVVGSNSFIPGFEDQLIGMSIGEDRDVCVKFPEDYHAENLKGKDSVFACKLHKIESKEYPEINEDFVKDVSEFATVEEYRASIRAKLQEDKDKEAERAEENALIEKIVNNATVPESRYLIENQMDDFVEEFKQRLQQQGLKIEDYLKYFGQNLNDYREQYRTQATQTVKSQLVLDAIIKAEKFEVTDEDLNLKLADYAKQIEKEVDEVRKTLPEQYLNYFNRQVVIEKFFDFLKANNTISADVVEEVEAPVVAETVEQTEAPAKKTKTTRSKKQQ